MPSSEGATVICLVGITGEGKSTTGNMLCQDASPFKTSRRMKSVTSECSFCDFDVNDVSYRVIDTPGLQDTDLSLHELHNRFRQFADLSPSGVDAFLFVVKRGRFRPEHVQAFNAFEEACGSAVLKHTVLLFTCLEDEDNAEFNESLESEDTPQTFRKCIDKVSGRAVGVENRLGGQERQIVDRELLLSCVGTMRELNQGRRYNNEQLQDASKWRFAIQVKAKQLEIPTNQQVVLQLLEERLHGRCERSNVQEKVAALLKSEARLKAKEVLDCMALMGQLKETCERLSFEAQQLPEACGHETRIMMGEFCARHRDCYKKRTSPPYSNHPNNCSLYPRDTSPDQVAASQRCQSKWVKSHKEKILEDSDLLAALAKKDKFGFFLEHLPLAGAFQTIAERVLACHKHIQETCSNMEKPCGEQMIFHICLDYPQQKCRECAKRFDGERNRIAAANARIGDLAKSMQELAVAAELVSAIRLQAVFRGRAARQRVSKMKSSMVKTYEDDRIDVDREEEGEVEQSDAPPSPHDQSQTPRKRRSRRGGMNQRIQKANEVDVLSIPATDDGFD